METGLVCGFIWFMELGGAVGGFGCIEGSDESSILEQYQLERWCGDVISLGDDAGPLYCGGFVVSGFLVDVRGDLHIAS